MAVIFTDGYTFFILYVIVNQIIKMILYTFFSVEFCGIWGKYDFTYIELLSIKKLFTFSLADYQFFCNLPPSIKNI